ncbi:hypothetical protein [Nocardia pneumoniae]|uniref:hypothetical protein n=1 Tax=Nocardia pneumoniae TaxID=228601 RepID=UPI0012F6BA9F|nr:hypothetical protein [Nocardia pneumoniae]
MGTMSSPNWLRRYRDGQREQVWHELRQLGSTILDFDLAEEAQLVCDEMALRARRNIEVIVDRLSEGGYQFHTNDDDQTQVVPFIPATARAAEHASWLRERFDSVPMTLLSWVRLVGDVWLVGTHPDWPESSSGDPLVIQVEGSHYPESSIRGYFTDELDSWSKRNDRHPGARRFVLPLAPDRYHKENVSGGDPYGIALPDGCVDGLFVAGSTMPFVSYLNWVFGSGGFPWPSGSDAQWRVCHALREDMLPL